MSKYDEIKERVYRCHMELVRQRMVITTFGNVSAIDRNEGIIAIKPSGIAYETMKPEDIVIVDTNGKIVDGVYKPSTDMRTHLFLYDHFAKIGGIAHTHSTHAVAWAQAVKPIPILGTTHADHLQWDIPCTDFLTGAIKQGDFETETGHLIIRTLSTLSYEELEMILVAGHGPFTWGKTPEKAVYNSVMLEELAHMALLTLQIAPETQRLPDQLIQMHYQRKHGAGAYYGQEV